MKIPLITAHSGCEGTDRDSMESIIRAIELGADAIEIDVRMNSEGTLYISHDIKSKANSRVENITLQDVLDKIKDTSLVLNMDVKEGEHIYPILDLCRSNGFEKDRVVVTGAFTPEQLSRDPSISDRVSVWFNIEEILKYVYLEEQGLKSYKDFSKFILEPWSYIRPWLETKREVSWNKVIDLIKEQGVKTLNCPQWILEDEKSQKILEENNIGLSVWTVDTQDSLNKFLKYSSANVINITTRQVDMALRSRLSIYNV